MLAKNPEDSLGHPLHPNHRNTSKLGLRRPTHTTHFS